MSIKTMRWLLAVVVAGLVGCAGTRRGGPPTVVFLSDFGTRDDAVAICKGVMLQVDPTIRTIDLTHDVPPFGIAEGARLIADTAPSYPAGTVFLAVVDPGVGSARRPMVARTGRGQYLVLPDNGLATLVAQRDGLVGTRELTNPAWMRAGGRSSTFHGRDVFAPAAAHLASGDDWTQAGPAIETPVTLDIAAASVEGDVLHGQVIATDGPYGNLLTNVDAAVFAQLGYAIGDPVAIQIGSERLTIPFVRTFSDVAVGAPLLYVDSRDRVGVAVNRGSFAAVHRVVPPTPVVLRRKGARP